MPGEASDPPGDFGSAYPVRGNHRAQRRRRTMSDCCKDTPGATCCCSDTTTTTVASGQCCQDTDEARRRPRAIANAWATGPRRPSPITNPGSIEMNRMRRLPAALAVLTLAAGLTACSTDTEPANMPDDTPSAEETTTADPTAHNDADTEFAQMMTIHHEGAIEMAELAAAQATTPEVRALGERIAAAQGPEIELMTGWLEAWGEDPPDEADMNAMGHSGMDMEGMDQEAVMAELSSLSGPELDRRFLELMIDHHRGAVEMAEEHHASGLNDDGARSLPGYRDGDRGEHHSGRRRECDLAAMRRRAGHAPEREEQLPTQDVGGQAADEEQPITAGRPLECDHSGPEREETGKCGLHELHGNPSGTDAPVGRPQTPTGVRREAGAAAPEEAPESSDGLPEEERRHRGVQQVPDRHPRRRSTGNEDDHCREHESLDAHSGRQEPALLPQVSKAVVHLRADHAEHTRRKGEQEDPCDREPMNAGEDRLQGETADDAEPHSCGPRTQHHTGRAHPRDG